MDDEFSDMDRTWGCEHDYKTVGDGKYGKINVYMKCVKCGLKIIP